MRGCYKKTRAHWACSLYPGTYSHGGSPRQTALAWATLGQRLIPPPSLHVQAHRLSVHPSNPPLYMTEHCPAVVSFNRGLLFNMSLLTPLFSFLYVCSARDITAGNYIDASDMFHANETLRTPQQYLNMPRAVTE